MGWWHGIRSVVRALVDRRAEERELAEDIAFHLEMEAAKLEREGHDPAEARRLARVRFGGVDRMMERVRDERGTRWLDDAWADMRYGWRALRHSPVFALTAVLTLGLGIGATSAVVTLVDGVLLRPLPFGEPDRLVELRELGEGRRFYPSFPNFVDWRDAAGAFDGMIGVRAPTGPQPVLGAGDPTTAMALGVTRDFLGVLGVAPAVGRDFTSEENAVGGDDVAMVSHAFWTTRFGADFDLEGARITIFGASYRVVGVLPPRFRLFYDADVYYPDERWPSTARASHAHRIVGRLRDGVTVDRAKAELDRIAAGIRERYPGESQAETVQVTPLQDVILGSYRRPLGLLLAASSLVLLLACANIASTLLARGSTREVEVAVRASLGASRGRLVRQLLIEALLIAALGASLGLMLAYAALQLAVGVGGDVLPRLGEVSLSGRTVGVSLVAAACTALAFGLYPALRLVGGSLARATRAGRGASAAQGRVWDVLLAGESALAVVLLVSAGLLVRSLLTIVGQDAGWDPEGTLEMAVTLPAGVFESDDEALAFARRLRDDLAGLPGLERVGMGTYDPLDAGAMTAPAREAGTEQRLDNYTGWRLVDGDYFRALGMRLERGRLLEPTDVTAGVINASLAEFLWPGEDPIGKRVLSNFDMQGTPIEVVGVVSDARDWRYHGNQTELYVPWWAHPGHVRGPLRYYLRTDGDPTELIAPARERLAALNPNVPADFEALTTTLQSTVADRRFVVGVLGSFALAGLLLSMVGVFGVVAYTVASRSREIGIRIALGAGRGRVRNEVRGRSLRAVALGCALGSLVSVGGAGVIDVLLYEVPGRDPVTLGAVVLLFLLTSLLASELPARRATRVEPVAVLSD
jgi:putative ABC transport system permease protein